MRAPLSIVIPTLNAAAAIGPLMQSLMEGLDAGVIRELILSDGDSVDDIAAIAEELGADLVSGPPGRGGQLWRGVAQTSGDWLLILHADCVLPRGWHAGVLEHINAHPDRAACFDLAFDDRSFGARWTASWANLRTRLFGLPYGDQGLLISRTAYDAAGGYPDIPLMEDVALVRALRLRPLSLGLAITTSAARYRDQGWLRRGSCNLLTLLRYFCGSDPEALAQKYRAR